MVSTTLLENPANERLDRASTTSLTGDTVKQGSRDARRRGRHRRRTDELLGYEALPDVECQADWILAETGIEVRGDDVALSLFRDAGASVDGARVRFDRGHARALCSTAPSPFRLHARDPERSVTLGGDHIVLMPGYGSPFVTDLDRGRRYASLDDFRNFVKLTYLSPWLHHSGGTVCEPVDIPVNKRHLDMVHAHLRYSTKPFMGGVTSPERAQDSIDMARLILRPQPGPDLGAGSPGLPHLPARRAGIGLAELQLRPPRHQLLLPHRARSGRVAPGISPRGAYKTVRDSLPSYGSSCPGLLRKKGASYKERLAACHAANLSCVFTVRRPGNPATSPCSSARP